MNCEYCHCRLFDTDRFCPSCGAPIVQFNLNNETSKTLDGWDTEKSRQGTQFIKVPGCTEATFVMLYQKVSARSNGRIPDIIIGTNLSNTDKNFVRSLALKYRLHTISSGVAPQSVQLAIGDYNDCVAFVCIEDTRVIGKAYFK